MSQVAPQAGRVAVTVLLLAVVAGIVAFLIVADPLGLGGGLDRGGADADFEDRDALDVVDTRPSAGEDRVSLQGLYGPGDLGAVKLRVLDVKDRRALAGHTLLLAGRRGDPSTAVTGEDGVALFTQVLPSRGYRLEIKVPDHAPVTVQGVKVVSGETTDLGDILLGRNVVVRGRVVDTTGRPLPGTSVTVFTPDEGLLADGFMAAMTQQVSSFPPALEEKTTDDDGWFALETLAAGTYRVEARLTGFATRYEGDVIVSEDRPAKDLTIVLGDGATVKGKVLDQNGDPVPNARVLAIKDTGRRWGRSGATMERDYTRTGAAGEYELDTLRQGNSYRFGVQAEGYATLYEMTATELQNEIQEKVFRITKGGGIKGQVVRKADGQPIAEARVTVGVGRMSFGRRSRDGEDQNLSAETVLTDDEGWFRIENVIPGPIMSAQVKAAGYVPYTASSWTGNSWGEVEAESFVEVPVIELAQGGRIEGVVADAMSGEGVPGAEVVVVPRERMWQIFMTGAAQGRADANGAFVIDGVPPGSYGVVATAPGFAASDAMAETNVATVPEEGGAVTHDVVLQRSGALTGVVTDSQGEPIAGARVRTRIAPEPRQEGGRRGGRGSRRMQSFLPGGSGVDLTDQNGRYRIEDVSPDRRWIVTAQATEFVPVESEPVQVETGEVAEIDLVLIGGGNLAGRVVDDRGQFVEGARVRVGKIPDDRAGSGRMSAWEIDRYLDQTVYFTDEDGRFLALNLPPGRAVVKVELEGYVTYYKRNAEIRPDETTSDYIVNMTRGETMEGVVKGPDGKPVRGALVAVTSDPNPGGGDDEEDTSTQSDDIEPRLTDRTNAEGRFEIENIAPGRYSVVVWFAPGFQGWGQQRSENAIRRDVDASSTNVEFRLEAATGGGGPGGGGR